MIRRNRIATSLVRWQDNRSLLVAVIVLMIALRIAAWASVGKLGVRVGNEMSTIAARMVGGYGFSSPYGPARHAPTTVEPPLFVWLTAGVFSVFGIQTRASFLVIQVLNLTFQCLTLILMLRIIRAKLSPAAGPVYAILFALSPLLIFLSANTWENCLTALLLTLIAYDVLLHWRTGMPLWRFGLFGLLLGVTSLSNSGWTLGYVPLCLGALYWNAGIRDWRMIPRLAIIVALFAAVTMPWTIRNYEVTGRFIFVRGLVGPELYKGNNPEALGGHGAGFTKYFLVKSQKERDRLLELGEVAYDDQMRQAAMDEIRSRPLAYAGRTVARVAMWWLGDFDLVLNHARQGKTKQLRLSILSMIACTASAILGFLGWLAARRNSLNVWVLSLYCFLLPLPYYFVVVGFRFRATLSPFILAFAAYWCAEMLLRAGAGSGEASRTA